MTVIIIISENTKATGTAACAYIWADKKRKQGKAEILTDLTALFCCVS